MSDRSGVGAPTHDGAEPAAEGSEEPAERPNASRSRGSAATGAGRRAAGAKSSGAGGKGSASGSRKKGSRSTADKVKRRISADLLGVTADDEATSPPPGVPVGRPDADAADAPSANGKGGAVSGIAPGTDTAEGEAPAPARAPAPAGAPAPEKSRQRDDQESPTRDDADTRSVPAAETPSTAPPDVSSPQPTVVPPLQLQPADTPSGVAPLAQAEPTKALKGRGPLRARRVHRIVRRVDPWSVLKLSLFFFFCVWVMVMISGVLLWGIAVGSGTVENIESFIATLLAFEEFRFNADQIFRLFAMGGLIMVFVATATAAILSVLFNLISDLIGGIRITVIEEETTRRIVRRS